MCVPSAFSVYLYTYILFFLHVYGHLSAINYLLLLRQRQGNFQDLLFTHMNEYQNIHNYAYK